MYLNSTGTNVTLLPLFIHKQTQHFCDILDSSCKRAYTYDGYYISYTPKLTSATNLAVNP